MNKTVLRKDRIFQHFVRTKKIRNKKHRLTYLAIHTVIFQDRKLEE